MKTNRFAAAIAICSALCAASALAAEFQAQIDRDQIAEDESVTLKLVVQADGEVPVEEPRFQAPGFETLNQFQSSFVESYYENGKVGARFTRSFNFILRPKNTGRLTISGISAKVGGQSYSSDPIVVTVSGGGGGTPPPRGYGGGGSGLRGQAKATRGAPVFLRAEVDKNRAYKGEQIIISYWLYTRVQAFNAQAEKFPELSGFLKEELNMPIIQNRLEEQIVTLDGVAYKRALLSRYAAYALREGKLQVDPMALKVSYYDRQGAGGGGGGGGEDDDEQDLFTQFFSQMTPRSSTVRSEPVTIEALPLPTAGRPADFSGAVGEFSVISAVDRYDVKAGDAISLTVKVEGRGNLSSVEAPKLRLPEAIDVYDSKSQTKGGQGGAAEKVFEYVLIPRKEGEYEIPGVAFTSFNPRAGRYDTKTTEAVKVRVAPGDPNAAPVPPPRAENRDLPSPEKAIQKNFSLQDSLGSAVASAGGGRWIENVSRLLVGLLALLALVGLGVLVKPWVLLWRRRGKNFNALNNQKRQKFWAELKDEARSSSGKSFASVLEIYERVSSRIYDALDAKVFSGARGISRRELREVLVEGGKIPEDLWTRVERVLEHAETVRFSSSAGAVSETRLRNELLGWVEEAERIESELP